MKKILDEYVYKNLDRYGNTIISNEEYEKIGKNKILNHLKKFGFNCKVRIVPSITFENKLEKDNFIVLEVI